MLIASEATKEAKLAREFLLTSYRKSDECAKFLIKWSHNNFVRTIYFLFERKIDFHHEKKNAFNNLEGKNCEIIHFFAFAIFFKVNNSIFVFFSCIHGGSKACEIF